MDDDLKQWIDSMEVLLNSNTQTYEQYVQMGEAFRNYINQRNAKEDINLWNKLWSGSVEMFYMILEGLQFEKAKYNVLNMVDAKKVNEEIELFDHDLESLLKRMKQNGLLTQDGQITSKGKCFLEEHTYKSDGV